MIAQPKVVVGVGRPLKALYAYTKALLGKIVQVLTAVTLSKKKTFF